MNIAILDVRKGEGRIPSNSITVAYRNLLILSRELKADLFVNIADINFKKKYDIIICGFGSISTEREYSTEFIIRNKEAALYWLVGEYEQSTFAPLFYCKRKFNIIKNYEHTLKNKMVSNQYFVNINALIARMPSVTEEKKYDLIYWGRWRDGRIKYFKKYMSTKDCYLSTSTKNMKEFVKIGLNPVFIKSFKWIEHKETLNFFRYSLYIEDEFTHDNFNSLANRFYEAIFCRVVQFFDISTANTLNKSMLDIDPIFIIDGIDDFKRVTAQFNYHELYEKQAHWGALVEKERIGVISKIKDILNSDQVGQLCP